MLFLTKTNLKLKYLTIINMIGNLLTRSPEAQYSRFYIATAEKQPINWLSCSRSYDGVSCWADEACGIDDTPWSLYIEYWIWELFSGGFHSRLYIRGFIVCGPGLNDDMFSYSEVNLSVVGTDAVAVTGWCLVETLRGWNWWYSDCDDGGNVLFLDWGSWNK